MANLTLENYQGEKDENGIPHGQGKIEYNSGISYEGEFIKGKFDGYGKLSDAGKVIYEGQWKANVPVGVLNEKSYTNGSIYQWDIDSDFHLTGNVKGTIYYFVQGEKYHGEVKNEIPHGYGVWTQRGGATQTGYWEDGKATDEWVLDWKDGRVTESKQGIKRRFCFQDFPDGIHRKEYNGGYFDGEWKNGAFVCGRAKIPFGLPARQAVFSCEGHDIEVLEERHVASFYEGEMMDGQFHGEGTYLLFNGTEYSGQWQHGVLTGKGVAIYAKDGVPTGCKYEGGWLDHKAHGYGVLVYENGSRYEGYFENHRFHGKGTSYDALGAVIKDGQWHDGKFME